MNNTVNMDWLKSLFTSYKSELSKEAQNKRDEGLITQDEFHDLVNTNNSVSIHLNKLERTIENFIKDVK